MRSKTNKVTNRANVYVEKAAWRFEVPLERRAFDKAGEKAAFQQLGTH